MWTCFTKSGVMKHVVKNSQLVNKLSFRKLWTCHRASVTIVKKAEFIVVNSQFRTILRHKVTETIKAPKRELWSLIKIAKPERIRLAGAIVLLLVSSSVTMAIPYCLGKVIDMFSLPPDELKATLYSFCQLLVIILAIGAVANFGRVYLMNMSSYSITNTLRKKTYNSILNQEIGFFDKTKTGELINRISADASVVGISVTQNISDGLRSTFSFLAGAALMIHTSPHLAMVGLLTVSPVAVLAVFYGRYLKKVTMSVQDSLASATEVADEKISNMRTVQAFAQQETEKNLYSEKIQKILHFATKESLGRAVFFGLAGFSGNLIALTVLYSGGLMMTDNLLTIGSLSSFLMYATYVGISIGGLSTFYAELMRGLGASTRLWELIERKPLISPSGAILRKLSGDIDFSGITFAYPSRPDINVLSGFNLSIPKGAVYAVVGPSGSGKSTLASLLLRFYDCSTGSVSVDGSNVKDLDVNWLRENIGIVSQEPVLFSSTIRENVMYGSPAATPITDVVAVLKEANAFDFIYAFPKGMDTIVGERGVMLSGGQRQRIAIARALLKNPRILILDEATSALDAQTENLVQSALEKLMKGRTVITIAHRLSTIRKADKIAVLDQGHIVEEGQYQELLQKQGLFYRLVQHQTIKS